MKPSFRCTRLACYYSYLSMASVFCVPALLFVTFHQSYGVSYTLLGTLVLINFCTQLAIDLIFTFFSKYFHMKLTVTVMPFITSAGLLLYGLIPLLFPHRAYLGLALGTVLFSVSAGLSEVLLSPIVAALPSDNPDRDMSRLHSLYGWGVVLMVLISTLYLRLFGTSHWQYLVFFLALFPVGAGILFAASPIPAMKQDSPRISGSAARSGGLLALFVGSIFLGSASENVMTNWISSYMESVLSISKTWCDIIGLALFATLLGLTRTLYAKYGKNIMKILRVGMLGCFFCYCMVALCDIPALQALACILVGIFSAMLWPGMLSVMEESLPAAGVAAYALMAAGGDCGAAVAPQLTGAVADMVAACSWAQSYASTHAVTPEQLGLKTGMAVAALFPLAGFVLLIFICKKLRKK